MSKQATKFRDLPLETRIIILISYSAVFGDVTSVESLAARIGNSSLEEINSTLRTLAKESKIVLKNGYAGLPHLEKKIEQKECDYRLREEIIGKRKKILTLIGKLPFIKHIGVSGSLAAGNGTPDKDKIIDVDLFVITRRNCLWFFYIPLTIYNNLTWGKRDNQLCFNSIIDETDLTIYNANLYTAHEMFHLFPITGERSFRQFREHNRWIENYFPGFTVNSETGKSYKTSTGAANKLFYLAYNIIRSIKHLSLKPLRESSLRLEPRRGINPNRVASHYGGYQALVIKKFCKIALEAFPETITEEIINILFPDELSRAILTKKLDAVKILIEAGIDLPDIKKYGESGIL